ncbi:MAG: DUF3857 domain-containing protein [Bacteroidales bacterium]|nr:DUF3857 domain-containing protein [Bacteroidales bacterium]
MKNILLSAILLALTVSFYSCNSKENSKEETINIEKDYPNADAVYLKMEKEYTLNENGSVIYRYAHKLKYLTHLSFNRLYGETFVVYEPEFQKLKINHSVTTMADGTKVVTPENAYNEVLPHFAENFPYLNNMREMVITHTGLEIGAIVDLDYEIRSQKDFFPFLMGMEDITASSPVKEMIIRVKVPKGKELNYFLKTKNQMNPSVSSEGNFSVYTWVFKNVPASSREMSAGESNFSVLQFSTEKMDKAIELVSEKIEYDKELPEQLKVKVDKIISAGKKGLILAKELQNLLISELNQFYVPVFYNILKSRTAVDVWNSNGATSFELAKLLRKVLRYAGFDAFITQNVNPEDYSNNVGNIFIFGEPLVRLDFEGEQYFLSPTYLNRTDYEFYMETSDFILVDKEDKAVIIDKEFPNNSLEVVGDLKLSDKMFSGTMDVVCSGTLNPYYNLLNESKGVSEFFSQSVRGKVVENNKPFSKLSFDLEQAIAPQGETDYFFVSIPMANNGIEAHGFKVLPEDRKSNLDLPYIFTEKYAYSISLSSDMKLISNNVNEKIENKLGIVHVIIEQTDGKINIERLVEIKKRIIKPEEYKDFKQIMDIWNNPAFREIVFKK